MRAVAVSFLFIVAVAAGVAVFFSAFVVNQYQQALVLEFGRTARVISDPGLNWRIPFVQTVKYFDNRILDLETDAQEVIASDQKRIVVDAFARYRITDPLKFYQAFTNEEGARQRLTAIVDSTLRSVLGRATFIDVVRNRREALMKQTAKQVADDVGNLGIEIVDVRIRRADLPESNGLAIYQRMKTERQREAAELRGQGSEQYQRITSDADRQVTIIRAEANRDAERTRGDGDGERNRIYAEAFGKDQDFFAFYRSMQSYEEALKGSGTRIVLSPTSDFFRYFNGSGVSGTPGSTSRTQPASPAAVPAPAGTAAAVGAAVTAR